MRDENFGFFPKIECNSHCRPKPRPRKDINLVCGKSCPVNFTDCKCQVAGFVEVDTRGYINPTVKVSFCANVFAAVTDKYCPNRVQLKFKLLKCCKNGCWVEVKRWFYFRDLDKKYYYGRDNDGKEMDEKELEENGVDGFCFPTKLSLETGDSFCFSSCECNTCPGCCLYKVVVENKSIGKAVVEINDVEIDAIAQSKGCYY